MNILEYAIQDEKTLFHLFQTSKKGLTDDQVVYNQKKYGYNTLSTNTTRWMTILFNQFKSSFLYLLILASLISFLFGQFIDGVIILFFILINTALGFFQEFRSEHILQSLKKYIAPSVDVIRDSITKDIKSADLVPGDMLIMHAGDIIPADIRLIETYNVTVDESVITGESLSVQKITTPLSHTPSAFHEAHNICFTGTILTSGKALGMVVATGKCTTMGTIAARVSTTRDESTFSKDISRLSTFILKLVTATLSFVFIVNIIIKGAGVHIPTLLVFSIALAVSVIPEALPVVITFSLSRGALKLSKHKVIIKRLSAIEDLGSIEILCTDKTGTLTENILTVANTFSQKDASLLYDAVCTSSQPLQTNTSVHSFDRAIYQALDEKSKKKYHRIDLIHENPFDPKSKLSSAIVKSDSTYEYIVKGAYEAIIPLCTHCSIQEKKNMNTWIKQEETIGRRIIAVAKTHMTHFSIDQKNNTRENLQMVGLISFADPIKNTAPDAITKAQALGVEVKILTGDSAEVAGTVATQIGLIADKNSVITGSEFDELSNEKQHEAVHNYAVFARVDPDQKYHIIQLLEERYEVGFVGEGINDAPALKKARVGIAVRGATDVAQQSADIILLKKSLHVIIDGIKGGREIFANTTKYIRATLSSNFGNFYTIALISIFIDFLPLLPLQILLVNLLTDFPMIAVVTDTVDHKELSKPRTYDIKSIALLGSILGIVSSLFDFIFFALFIRFSHGVLQTNWFIGSVITELVFLFSIRSRLSLFKARPPSFTLVTLSCIAGAVTLLIPFTMWGQKIFSFVAPQSSHLLMIAGVSLTYFILTEQIKLLYYRFYDEQTKKNQSKILKSIP